MTELTHLSLFSGIGGLDLAAEAAGFQTVGQCEWADYPTTVLEKHWPDVPRWRDIRTLTGDDFYARTGRRSVTVISGGFPCQPFSVAGKRRGKEDDRYLWPEMCRVISEIRPTWVIGENVPGIVSLALDAVLSDLESQGYACQTFIIPAAGVDAPHRRERVCIVGYTKHNGLSSTEIGRSTKAASNNEQERQNATRKSEGTGKSTNGFSMGEWNNRGGRSAKIMENSSCSRCGESPVLPQQQRGTEFERNGKTVADPLRFGSTAGLANTATWEERQSAKSINGSSPSSNSESAERSGEWREARGRRPELGCSGWWPAEPDVGRVANGIPSRVDRLKCLGNAVVPAQFYPFFKYIAEIERQTNEK